MSDSKKNSGAGKGDSPRNCFSKSFRDNYDGIKNFGFKPKWQQDSKQKEKKNTGAD